MPIADGLKLQMLDAGSEDHPRYFQAAGGDHQESMPGVTDGSRLSISCVREAYAR